MGNALWKPENSRYFYCSSFTSFNILNEPVRSSNWEKEWKKFEKWKTKRFQWIIKLARFKIIQSLEIYQLKVE